MYRDNNMLNNVCMWSSDGWIKITAEEVAKNNVLMKKSSEHSRLFRCEICRQYVRFINGNVQKPHFRHSASEQDKECKDRSQQNLSVYDANTFTRPRHDLPIKICVDEGTFYFEIGLLRLPNELFNKILKSYLTITAKHFERKYSLSDCLIEDDITWLQVGNIFDESYTLALEPTCTEIFFYWSREIEGVNKNHGTLFDARNGRKIPFDSDVQINKRYYLLTKSNFINSPASVDIISVADKSVYNEIWRLYEVKATAFTEGAANFFWNYGCRLATKPISIKSIWPTYITEPYIICHDSPSMFFYLSGDVITGFFPSAKNSVLSDKDNAHLLKVECNERQQIMAIGHMQPSQYIYLWQGLPSSKVALPKIIVTDIFDNVVFGGIFSELPKNAILQVFTEFDARIVIRKNETVMNQIFIKADSQTDIDSLGFGMEIKIFQGLDCVWQIRYERLEETFSFYDEKLYRLLERSRGKLVKIPHTWGNVADKLGDYPKVKNWLYKSIRSGVVPEESYSTFKQFLLKHGKV